MKTERNILFAFLLNLFFSIFEFFGGLFTHSIAILSDSIHDLGDALSIGISYFFEKKSKQKPDNKYTYGYIRYSVLGGFITTMVLLISSSIVIYNAIKRIINPIEINYQGMIILAIFGVIINFIAAYLTHEKGSINQKAVNLHMLEDVLGWIIVLIGAIVMKFTNIKILDPIMSICVAIFIIIQAIKNLIQIIDLFLEKTPKDINIDHIKKHLYEIQDIENIHHIHIWSIDGYNNYATMHIVTKSYDIKNIKKKIREELKEFGIIHVTLEIEDEICEDIECNTQKTLPIHHHHHH